MIIHIPRLSEGADVVRLHHLVHPDSKSASHPVDPSLPLETIKVSFNKELFTLCYTSLQLSSFVNIWSTAEIIYLDI